MSTLYVLLSSMAVVERHQPTDFFAFALLIDDLAGMVHSVGNGQILYNLRCELASFVLVEYLCNIYSFWLLSLHFARSTQVNREISP